MKKMCATVINWAATGDFWMILFIYLSFRNTFKDLKHKRVVFV